MLCLPEEWMDFSGSTVGLMMSTSMLARVSDSKLTLLAHDLYEEAEDETLQEVRLRPSER